MTEQELLPYEKGQEYIRISDVLGESIRELVSDEEFVFECKKLMAFLGDRLDDLGSHYFSIYNSVNFQRDYPNSFGGERMTGQERLSYTD